MQAAQALTVLKLLTEEYPAAVAELHFSNPYETLVATMLAAQCTDRRVNMVTESLFRDYPSAAHMARLTPEELEPRIHECGLYHSKARNIIAACRDIMNIHAGAVPDTMEALVALPGVGRKTANCVLANAFGQDAIAVDTHVFRVTNRIGLAQAKDVTQTEQQLMDILPKQRWSHAHHLFIYHGRRCCHARNAECARCILLKNGMCEHPQS